ncbi:unnamed protein product [Ixodes pacificus]
MLLRMFLLAWLLAGILGQVKMLKVLVSETSTGTVKLTSVQTTSTPAEQTPRKNAAENSTTVSGETNEEIEDANDFVDQILEEVQTSEAIQAKITPAVLGDLHYNGFKLSNAVLHGVNSVYRSDNCTFHFSDTSFDVLVHLGAKDLHLESGWSRTWLYIPFGGHVGAKLRDVSIFMDINVGKDGAPTLRRLKVIRLSDIHVTKATGASVLFNWALRSILNWVVNANKGKIIQLVETDGAMAINEAMKDLGSKLNSLNEFRRR